MKMIKIDNSNYSTHNEISAVIQFAQALGLSVLPVIPAQDANKYPKRNKQTRKIERDKNGNPIPLFTGKNPSFFDQKGEPQTIFHSAYQDKLPTDKDLHNWFADPATNGIGVLGNSEIKLIDVDVKNFDSIQHCEEIVEQWLTEHSILRGTWSERTRSGGYRLGVRVENSSKFTNYKFIHYPHHVGELVGFGRFAVLAPTPGYEVLQRCEPVEIESVESIGMLPISQEKSGQTSCKRISRTENFESIRTLSVTQDSTSRVSIYKRISKKAKDLLDDKNFKGDRSAAITTVIKELYGWKNHFDSEGKQILEDIDDIIQEFSERLDIDESRLKRIFDSINLDDCTPTREYYASESANFTEVAEFIESVKFDQLTKAEGFELNPDEPDGVLATLLAEKFSEILIYCESEKSWFHYASSEQHWMRYEEDSRVESLIMDAIDQNTTSKGKYSSSKISGIRRLLKAKLTRSRLTEQDTSQLLPLKNGVLNLKTKQLCPHDPKYGFTYLMSLILLLIVSRLKIGS